MKISTLLHLLVAYTALTASAYSSTVLFSDSFDRPDTSSSVSGTNLLNDSDAGKSGMLGALDWVIARSYNRGGTEQNGVVPRIFNNQLQDYARGGSGNNAYYVNHNFIDQPILDAKGFQVSVTIAGWRNQDTGSQAANMMGIALGMNQARASDSNPTLAYQSAPLFIGFSGGYNVSESGGVSIYEAGSLVDRVAVTAGSGTQGGASGSLSAKLFFTDYEVDTLVKYEISWDGEAIYQGDFVWGAANTNYIGLSANADLTSYFDNFEVKAIPEPAVSGLLVTVGLIVGLLFFKARRP